MVFKTLLRSLGCGQPRIFPFALAAALAATMTAVPALALDVHNDTGGSVNARLAELNTLRATNERVRILGSCLSACTLYLGLPTTCVAPTARLGFHGPSSSIRGLPLPWSEFERVTEVMASHYPGPLRRWFLHEARMRLEGYYEVSGREAIRLGARACT